jgi:hypothetical protein
MKHRTYWNKHDEKAQADSLSRLTTIDLEAMRKELIATLPQDRTPYTREWLTSVNFILGKRRGMAT